MKNRTMKLKKAVDKRKALFYSGNPPNICSLALMLIVAVFAGQSGLFANASDTNKGNKYYCLPVNELFQWVAHIEGMDQKNKEFLTEELKRHLQDIQEFEAFKDPSSEDYSILVRKIAPVIYEGCHKDLEKVEGNAYMKAFLEFYRPDSEKYQSLGRDQREFVDMCYNCFAL
jgi:hypothetical protein